MNSDSDTEECVAVSKNYHKMKTSVHKIGFIEGLTAGKEAAFQTGFDSGYAQGFSAGFKLGKLNGILRTLQEASRSDESLTAVKSIDMEVNTRRGMCVLCNPQVFDKCMKSADSDQVQNCSPLEITMKSQQQIIEEAIIAHREKMKEIYQIYNISFDSNLTSDVKNIEI